MPPERNPGRRAKKLPQVASPPPSSPGLETAAERHERELHDIGMEEAQLRAQLTQLELQEARDKERRAEEKHQAMLESHRRAGSMNTGGTGGNSDGEFDISTRAAAEAAHFPRLPRTEIIKISENRFHPMNLYKLRRGYDDEDREGLYTIEDGQLKVVRGGYKDYGGTPAIWEEAFLQYVSIVVDVYGVHFPDLHRAIMGYYTRIKELASVYQWQGAVLPLALTYHETICDGNVTDACRWTLPDSWVCRYCTATTQLGFQEPSAPSASRKRWASTALAKGSTKRAEPNTGEILCKGWNSAKGCKWRKCNRTHRCTKCRSSGHGATSRQECPDRSRIDLSA